jgi:hypothetical protein
MHHLPSINIWLGKELSEVTKRGYHLITSATLVDFPQFPDMCYLIPRLLDPWPSDRRRIEDSGLKWEIYLKYRQIVSRFLTDETRSGSLFVVQSSYVSLAKYLVLFLTKDME